MNDLEAGGTEPPLHVFRTRIWFDELDKVGVLHNARYAVHAERALSTWSESRPELIDGPDMRHLVKAYEVEFRVPVAEVGELDVELRVVKIGTTSCGPAMVAISGSTFAVETWTCSGSGTR